MLKASIGQPSQLSARVRAGGGLSARLGGLYVPGGMDAHRPATREEIGEVVVGAGLDVEEDGLLSVADSVVAGDYATAANNPSINGRTLAGDVALSDIGIEFATDADIHALFHK